MQKITPHLWFDTEARNAAELYVSLFPGSKITNVTTLSGTPSGDCDLVSFELAGQPFMAISPGPLFKFNVSHKFAFHEALSFILSCETQEEIDYFWGKLSAERKAEQCGWLKDKYGLSWQIAPAVLHRRSRAGGRRLSGGFIQSTAMDAGVRFPSMAK